MSTLAQFIYPNICHNYQCSSQEEVYEEISIKCKNVFLSRINMFKAFPNKPFFLCLVSKDRGGGGWGGGHIVLPLLVCLSAQTNVKT